MTNAHTDSFDPEKFEGDRLIFSISRDEVLAGKVGPTVDRLMRLTDSKPMIGKWRGKLALRFDGMQDDAGKINNSPELVRFFRQINQFFPFWLHFCQPQGKSIPMVLALLCDCDEKGRVNMDQVLTTLTQSLYHFYRVVGLNKEAFDEVLAEIRQGLRT